MFQPAYGSTIHIHSSRLTNWDRATCLMAGVSYFSVSSFQHPRHESDNSMAPTTTCAMTSSDSERAEFIIPDFFSKCRYPMRLNPHCYLVSLAFAQWLCDEAHLVEPETTKYTSLRAGYLVSACYPDADASHLRFESARYFGKDAHIVKRERIVKLPPK